jgi:hypothetical protein
MNMPVIENKWTIGNVLVLVAMVVQAIGVGAGGLWYASSLDARISLGQAASVETRAIAVDAQTVARANQLVLAGQASDLRNILTLMQDIKTTLADIQARP